MRKIKITTRGCPWQNVEQSPFYDFPKGKYGWNPFKVLGWGRYGGNWAFKLGVEIGSQMTNIHFGLGTIEIKYPKPVETKPVATDHRPVEHHVRKQKTISAQHSRAALVAAGIEWKEFNKGLHLRVTDDYDFYPTTGLYIHRHTRARGQGVRSLIKDIKRNAARH